MKADKTSLPAHRDVSDRSRAIQIERNAPSVGQAFGELRRILQREALFGLQLLLAFSVSYTAVQLTRNWLSQSGMIAPAPSVYSARVFWPENTLALFPKPVTQAAAAESNMPAITPSDIKPAKAPEPAKPADKALSEIPKPEPVRIAITRSPVTRQITGARLHTARNANAYRWATPAPRYIPRTQPRYIARRPVRLPQAQYRSQARVAAHKPVVKPVPSQAAVRPVQRMLREDYQVSNLKSYDEYMKWVKRTLKEYNGG